MQPQADPFIVPVCNEQIEILYQDEYILLINKPSRLLSLSGKHPLNKDSVHYRLVQDFPTATLVHRLDFGTSGIMLVALNKEVNGMLTKQFQARATLKTYTALLYGQVPDDIGSIDFYSLEKVDFLASTSLLKTYLTDKKQKLEIENETLNQDSHLNKIDTRQLTNVGTFRAYIEMYLNQNTNICNDLTCMVRQLPATSSGLPLELYCFANTTDWVKYEAIQADVFDHLFAIAPHFDLRIFQHPTGFDWKN